MNNFKKILEIKGTDWMKGYSTQGGVATNGIFRTAVNFNPFELMGLLQPSLATTALTAPADAIRNLTSFYYNGTGYFYALTDTKLYSYLVASPFTQSDQTAQFTATYPKAGAIIWKGKYIYSEHNGNSRIWANSIPVQSGNEVSILAGTANCNVRPMCIGADGNLYVGTRDYVSQLTSATGTAGNTEQAFLIDDDWTVRQLVKDGNYLVILADNNDITTTARVVGEYRCRVYYWDMAKPTADVIWEFNDSYIIGGEFMDGKTYIFTYNGIYVCNLVTSPKMIWDFRGNSSITKRPTSPYQITAGSQDIYWGDGGTNGQQIYALRGTTFYAPYATHSSTYKHTAISKIGDLLVAATDGPTLAMHNTGTTRANATIQTATEQLSQPYTYGFTKVTLKTPLSSGQSVNLYLYNGNDSLIADQSTKSYSADGALKCLIFSPKPTSSSVTDFEDIYININPVGGAVIERVTVYGTPLDDYKQS